MNLQAAVASAMPYSGWLDVAGIGCVQLEPAVPGWNRLCPAGTGCVWLGHPILLSQSPCSPRCCWGTHTQCNITYIQIFLLKQSKILSWENAPYFSARFINILKLSASLASCQQGGLAAFFCAGTRQKAGVHNIICSYFGCR